LGVLLKKQTRSLKYNFKNYYKKTIHKNSYLSHGIHTYTAKLIPQIPKYFIEKYSNYGDTIFDPFCGSGTTLLEAKLSHRNSVGIDLNPLAILISKVKTYHYNIKSLEKAIIDFKKCFNIKLKTCDFNEIPNINYWLSRKVKNDLITIRSNIEMIRDNVGYKNYLFFLVCFSSIIRTVSYADNRIAKLYKSKREIEKIDSGWKPDTIKIFFIKLDNVFKTLSKTSPFLRNNAFVKTYVENACQYNKKLNKKITIDYIITSPPYINAQDYYRSYKLELWILNLLNPLETKSFKSKIIGSENYGTEKFSKWKIKEIKYSLLKNKLIKLLSISPRKASIVYNYFSKMETIISEFSQTLEQGKYFTIVLGNNTISKIKIPCHIIIKQIAKNYNFELVEIGKDEIKSRSLPPFRNHTNGYIFEEWILTFRKNK